MSRVKYLATAFLLRLDRCQYGELILDLKNDYAKQQRNHPKTITDMYGLMVVFEPTRMAAVTGGHNEGLKFGTVANDTKYGGYGYVDSGRESTWRKRYGWNCGGDQLKMNCPKLSKDRAKKDEDGKWCIQGSSKKCSNGKSDAKDR